MNTYLLILLSMVLFVLVVMTLNSMRRKEPVIYSVMCGGITGACFMLLVILVATM